MAIPSYIVGPVTAKVEGGRETLSFFGHTATRIMRNCGCDLFYRTPDRENEPVSDSFGEEIKALMALRDLDERDRQEKYTGQPTQTWRVCLSPRVAALLAFRDMMTIDRPHEQDELPGITYGKTKDDIEWACFPASPIMRDWGFTKIEVSPAHIGLSFVADCEED